jgi:aryl-alcohol dehydrogenase-like predicted oxidoreductase
MFHRERVEMEYAGLYEEIGLGTTTWSPLASGLLTGKYDDLSAPNDSRANVKGMEWLRDQLVGDKAAARVGTVKGMKAVADDLGCTRAQLAIAWCLKNPNVSSVITGASKPEQVLENMKALGVAKSLHPSHMDRIEKLLGNKPDPGTNCSNL